MLKIHCLAMLCLDRCDEELFLKAKGKVEWIWISWLISKCDLVNLNLSFLFEISGAAFDEERCDPVASRTGYPNAAIQTLASSRWHFQHSDAIKWEYGRCALRLVHCIVMKTYCSCIIIFSMIIFVSIWSSSNIRIPLRLLLSFCVFLRARIEYISYLLQKLLKQIQIRSPLRAAICDTFIAED